MVAVQTPNPVGTQAVIKQMSIPALREALRPAETLQIGEFDPAATDSEFYMDGGRVRFRVGGHPYHVRADAYMNLAKSVGVPQALVQKAPADLVVPVVNWFMKEREAAALRTIGYAFWEYQGEPVVEMFSKGVMSPISNYLFLDILAELAPDANEVWHASLNPFSTAFSVVTRHEEAIRVGDPIRTGVSFENSYALSSAPQVSTYVQRLVCTNGMTSAESVFRLSRRGFGGDGINDWIRDAIGQALEAGADEVQKMASLQDVSFEGHLAESLGSIFTELNVPAGIRQEINDGILNTGVATMYDVLNVVTDIASNNDAVLAQPELQRRLMRIGGQMAANPDFCPVCHRLRHD